MRFSLRGRLAAALAAVAAVSVGITAAVAYGLLDRFAREQALQQLRRDASVLSRQSLSGDDAPRPRVPVHLRTALQLLQASGDHFARIGPGPRIVAGDAVAEAVAAAVVRERGTASRAEGMIEAGGTRYAYVLVPIFEGSRSPGAVLLARPASLAADLLRPVAARVALGGMVALAIALAISWVIARRLSGRVHRLAEAAGSIAAGDLAHRVSVEGGDEIAELAHRFNLMASSLSEARRREREFLASVSHELRTPVTAIRGYAGAIADGTASSAQEQADALGVIDLEAERLERLVQDVVDLGRLGSDQFRLELGEVDVSATIDETVLAHAAQAADAGVHLDAHAAPSLRGVTDTARVRQILSNLVENALRVTPPGGRVRITGRAEDGWIVIDVADTGPGIAAADLPHVFERGYLWNAYTGRRSVGTGLGLAIVRELAPALGGRVDVASEPGRGTTFRLWLPAV